MSLSSDLQNDPGLARRSQIPVVGSMWHPTVPRPTVISRPNVVRTRPDDPKSTVVNKDSLLRAVLKDAAAAPPSRAAWTAECPPDRTVGLPGVLPGLAPERDRLPGAQQPGGKYRFGPEIAADAVQRLLRGPPVVVPPVQAELERGVCRRFQLFGPDADKPDSHRPVAQRSPAAARPPRRSIVRCPRECCTVLVRVRVEKSAYRSFSATVRASMPDARSRSAVRCERRSSSRQEASSSRCPRQRFPPRRCFFQPGLE